MLVPFNSLKKVKLKRVNFLSVTKMCRVKVHAGPKYLAQLLCPPNLFQWVYEDDLNFYPTNIFHCYLNLLLIILTAKQLRLILAVFCDLKSTHCMALLCLLL